MDIDFSRVQYVTNRKLKDKNKEPAGQIIMYSYDELNFHYKMTCPFCDHTQEEDTKFERRPYRILCSSCGKTSTIEKLKSKK